jgi:hypothetical protein
MKLNYSDLRTRYEDLTNHATANCTLTTELVGGQPASEDGIKAYVEHHLHLTGPEAENAVKRISAEEVGEKPVPSETGEQAERITYGLNVIRRDEHGPWLGDWMCKACLKCAGSRLGFFASKRGTKGDMAEMGNVRASGVSLLNPEHPERIYLIAPDSDGPAPTYFQKFMGRVQTPKGSVSIVNEAECAAPGTRFSFEYFWPGNKLEQEDMANLFACAMVIGLGSCKALERGKFRIDDIDIEMK